MASPRDLAHIAERTSAAERRVRAFELRKQGKSFRAIGVALGVSHAQAARYVDQELNRLNAQSRGLAEAYRRVHLERCEDLLAADWQAAVDGDLAAQAAVLRILERESKLLGLDAPAKMDVESKVRLMAIEAGIDPDQAVAEAERLLKAARD
jgi:hypothetical protein